MIDPLSTAGLAYPIAKDLFKVARRLRRACRHIHHAKTNLDNMINRTETVADTYKFFRDTMTDAKKMEDLATTFGEHGKLIWKIEAQACQIKDKLQNITRTFLPLLHSKHVSTIQRWIAQFEWYRQEKKVAAPVLLEMQILEGSMNLVAHLTIIQILQNMARKLTNGQESIQMEIEHLIKSMNINFKKLQMDQRVLEKTLKQRFMIAEQDVSVIIFAQQVLQLLSEEIPKLCQNHRPHSSTTPGSGRLSSSSASWNHVPSTAPSSPPRPNVRGLESTVPSHLHEIPTQSPEAPSRIHQQQQQQPHTYPLPESPSPPQSPFRNGVGAESEHQGVEDGSPQPGPYVPMPPFGPPEARPRPRPGRSSPD